MYQTDDCYDDDVQWFNVDWGQFSLAHSRVKTDMPEKTKKTAEIREVSQMEIQGNLTKLC